MHCWRALAPISLVCTQAATGCAANEPAAHVAALPTAEVILSATPLPHELPAVEAPPPESDPAPSILRLADDAQEHREEFEPVQGAMGPASVGTAPPVPPAPSGTPARLTSTRLPDCPFPPEADDEKVDNATVRLVVRVDETGKPLRVLVVADPGHGFGRAARNCLLSQVYVPGRNDAGVAVTADTGPIVVRFSR